MAAQPPANVEAVSTGNHDVEKKECGWLAFGVGNDIGRGAEDFHSEAGGFQVMLYQAGDICIIFKNEYCLAQTCFPRRDRRGRCAPYRPGTSVAHHGKENAKELLIHGGRSPKNSGLHVRNPLLLYLYGENAILAEVLTYRALLLRRPGDREEKGPVCHQTR